MRLSQDKKNRASSSSTSKELSSKTILIAKWKVC